MCMQLADFGLACTFQGKPKLMNKEYGTPGFMAPEVIECQKGYDTKCDVFSFGMVLWAMTGTVNPLDSFALSDKNEQVSTYFQGAKHKHTAKALLQLTFNPAEAARVCPGYVELVNECLAKDPKRRPAFGRTTVTRLELLMLF